MHPGKVLEAGVPLLVGTIFIGVGLWLFPREAEDREPLVATTGTIVDAETRFSTNSAGRTVREYVPVVEFHADGGTYRFSGQRTGPRLSNGQAVDVLYDPVDPGQSARVRDDRGDLGLMCFFAMGVLSFLVGLRATFKLLLGALRGPRTP